jgi:hypothetical protein
MPCVLGRSRGVQRDPHQEFANTFSRLKPSQVVNDVRQTIRERIATLSKTHELRNELA